MAPIFLNLIFRNVDGSFTFVSWIFGVGALLMGIWCLVAPESYRRLMVRGRSDASPAGRLWAFANPRPKQWEPPSRGWVRFGGAVAIALAVGFVTWVVFFSVPGRLY